MDPSTSTYPSSVSSHRHNHRFFSKWFSLSKVGRLQFVVANCFEIEFWSGWFSGRARRRCNRRAKLTENHPPRCRPTDLHSRVPHQVSHCTFLHVPPYVDAERNCTLACNAKDATGLLCLLHLGGRRIRPAGLFHVVLGILMFLGNMLYNVRKIV